VQTKDKAFADAFARAIGDEHRDRGPLRRAFKEVLAIPLARRVDALAARPTFGPHEGQGERREGLQEAAGGSHPGRWAGGGCVRPNWSCSVSARRDRNRGSFRDDIVQGVVHRSESALNQIICKMSRATKSRRHKVNRNELFILD
jgi:hypothetical protein